MISAAAAEGMFDMDFERVRDGEPGGNAREASIGNCLVCSHACPRLLSPQ